MGRELSARNADDQRPTASPYPGDASVGRAGRARAWNRLKSSPRCDKQVHDAMRASPGQSGTGDRLVRQQVVAGPKELRKVIGRVDVESEAGPCHCDTFVTKVSGRQGVAGIAVGTEFKPEFDRRIEPQAVCSQTTAGRRDRDLVRSARA